MKYWYVRVLILSPKYIFYIQLLCNIGKELMTRKKPGPNSVQLQFSKIIDLGKRGLMSKSHSPVSTLNVGTTGICQDPQFM